MAELSMREAYGRALAEYGMQHLQVLALDVDTSVSTLSSFFAARFPERFFNIGIAEPCMVDVAAGLALGGFVPFINGFASLLSLQGCFRGREDMANFYTDNEDIKFLFTHFDMARLAAVCEEDFKFAKEFDFAPADAKDAVDNYERILKSVGQIAGDDVAPTAEETDKVGNVLNTDGSVTYTPGIRNAIKLLGQADLRLFTSDAELDRFHIYGVPNLESLADELRSCQLRERTRRGLTTFVKA